MTKLRTRKIEWQAWRIIPSRNPPIDLYQRVAPAEDWKPVIEVETLTNPRVRELREGLGLVRPEDLKGGATQNWILAPFTYLNPEGTRFSDGSFGSCFLAKDLATALLESIRLRERFLSFTNQKAIRLDMRVIKTDVAGEFEAEPGEDTYADAGSRHDYWKARQLDGSDGVYFRASELGNGECIEAFRPRFMTHAVQERHLTYCWDGTHIAEVYDFFEGKNVDMAVLRTQGKLVHFEREPQGRIRAISR